MIWRILILIACLIVAGSIERASAAPPSVRLTASVGAQTLTLWVNGHPELRAKTAMGALATPTPTGHFRVIARWDGAFWGGRYGCCVLALNVKRVGLPVAIHGLRPGSVLAKSSTLGCIGVGQRALRRLWRLVPVGTPVVIKP